MYRFQSATVSNSVNLNSTFYLCPSFSLLLSLFHSSCNCSCSSSLCLLPFSSFSSFFFLLPLFFFLPLSPPLSLSLPIDVSSNIYSCALFCVAIWTIFQVAFRMQPTLCSALQYKKHSAIIFDWVKSSEWLQVEYIWDVFKIANFLCSRTLERMNFMYNYTAIK